MKLLSQMRRTPYQTIGIIITLTVSFTVLFIFTAAILVLTQLVSYIKTQPQVSVYFLKTTPKSNIFKLREELLQTGKARDVVYISQEQAFKFYKNITKNEPLLQEMATKEALPASLEIYAVKPEYLEELAQEAKKDPGVESVEFQKDIINNLIKVTNSITIAAIIFLATQLLIVFFMVFMASTFKIMRRKQEIEILRLLGASRFFILRPLLNEGFMINLISVIISTAVFAAGYIYALPTLKTFMYGIPDLSLFSWNNMVVTVWPMNIYFIALLSIGTLLLGNSIIFIATVFAGSRYIH